MKLPQPGSVALCLFVAAGAVAGWCAFVALDIDQLRTVSLWLAPIVTGLAALVLTLRLNMLSTLHSLSGLSIGEMEANNGIQAQVGSRTLQVMVALFCLGLVTIIPAASAYAIKAVYAWMAIGAGVAAGIGLTFSYLVLHWREEVSLAVARRKLAGEKAARQAQLIKEMSAAPAVIEQTTNWAQQSPLTLNGY